MSWKLEIYRVLFIVLGMTEVLMNLNYLIKKNGLIYAKKQHCELPSNATDKQLLIKVILMFSFGVAFLLTGLYSYYIKIFPENMAFIILLLFTIYAIVEAICYKYWKTTGFSIVATFLFVMYIFI